MTTDASEQRLVHLICGAMTVGRVSLRQRRWRSTPYGLVTEFWNALSWPQRLPALHPRAAVS